MIELYRGKINLKDPLVAKHAEAHINKRTLLDPTRPHYERTVEKFIYWYTDLSRIKYPVTAVIAGKQLLGIHPGTSRVIAQYLKGVKFVDCIAMVIIHQDSRTTLQQLMPDATPLSGSEAISFDAGDNNWEFRLKDDTCDLEDRDINKTNKKYFWNLHPGMRWFHNNQLLLDRSKPGEKPRDIAVVCPLGLYQSLTHLINNSPKLHKVGTFYFVC
tara:strand:+ start:57 stop:701 length:645 start_codon:yes stop_codon:yes gene_type:complete